MKIKKKLNSYKKFPLWLKVIFGIVILFIFSIGIALIPIAFIGINIYSDQKTEENIDKKFHREIAMIPEIKIVMFRLWEGDSLVSADILNKGRVVFWYGTDGIPRIDAINGASISPECYYIDQNGIKNSYAGDVSLVLGKGHDYKKWFPFEVNSLQELVNRYDDITKIVASFPKNPETEIFHDKVWGDRYVVKNPNPNFVVYRKVDNKEVTCDLLRL